MKFRLNKQAAFKSLIAIFCLMACSTGFDLYAHTTLYYYYNEPYIHKSYVVFNSIYIPRYILLSSIYEVFSRLGVPIGIVIITLITMPIYSIFYYFEKISRTNYKLTITILLFFIYYLSFQYSGLSMVLLYMTALFLSGNKKFIIGSMFHPVGLLISIVLIIIFRRKYVKHLVWLLISLIMLYDIAFYFDFFTTVSEEDIKYSVSFDSFNFLFQESFESKKNIFYLVFIVALIYIILHNKAMQKMMKKINQISLSKITVNFLSFIFVSTLILYMSTKQNPNLFYSLVTGNINDVMYISWFDWGYADIHRSYFDIFNERIIASGGLDEE